MRAEFNKLPGSMVYKAKTEKNEKREPQESGADETLELTTQSGADSSAATLPMREAGRQEVETELSDVENTRNVLRNELDTKSADSDENKWINKMNEWFNIDLHIKTLIIKVCNHPNPAHHHHALDWQRGTLRT